MKKWLKISFIVLPLLFLILVIIFFSALPFYSWYTREKPGVRPPSNYLSPYADLIPTEVKNGTLAHDETWSGVVQVTGTVIVPEGVTLTIEPGTIIRFAHNREKEYLLTLNNYFDWPKPALHVRGTLISIGSPDNLIIFTSDALEPRGADWRGIILNSMSSRPANTSIIKYSIIEYAHKSIMLAMGPQSPVIVENNIIRFADQITLKSCKVTLFLCFGSPELDVGSGVTYWAASSPIVRGNIMYNNICAIEASGSGTPVFENNVACFNIDYNQKVLGSNGVRTGAEKSNNSPVFRNNLLCGNDFGIEFNWGSKAVAENNIILWNDEGLDLLKGSSEPDSYPSVNFNDLWGNNVDYAHTIINQKRLFVPAERFGKGNVAIDPLFTEEDFYNANFNFTQPGLKDSGNPELFDKDGSRSDIGPNWNWSWVTPDMLIKKYDFEKIANLPHYNDVLTIT